jgi:hypothetical protein
MMKSNQLMQVNLGGKKFPIEHKTMMGSLTDIWNIGNSFREEKGLKPLGLGDFLRSTSTHEFVEELENDLGIENSKYGKLPHLESLESGPSKKDGRVETIKSELIKTKRGKNGGTWAHLYILLEAAARLDAGLRLKMYKTFISGKLLEWRDSSGDEFQNLNIAIDAYLPGREGKENTGIYITCAKRIKEKVNPDGGSWNTATHQQLKHRTEIEKKIVGFLEMGFINDYHHLKQVISKI